MDKKVKLSNNPFDWALQLALICILPIVVVLAVVFGARDKWETWVIIALICALFLYFGGMLIYKIYHAKLSFVHISEDGVSFGYKFKSYAIPADKLKVALVDDGKQRAKGKMFIQLYDENEIGTVVMLGEKRVTKLNEVAPPAIVKFFVQVCETQTLEGAIETAPERIKPYIQEELDSRAQAIQDAKRQAADRQRAQEKARQRKRNKRKKKNR